MVESKVRKSISLSEEEAKILYDCLRCSEFKEEKDRDIQTELMGRFLNTYNVPFYPWEKK